MKQHLTWHERASRMGLKVEMPVKPSSVTKRMDDAALDKYLAEVDARTQLRAYEAMERHINGDGRRKVENCDGYDPFGW